MSDTVKVRIGLEGARELEVDVEDGESVASTLEAGLAVGGIVWIVDAKGDRHGINVDKLAFVELQGEDAGGEVGFAPPA
jgi:hypothetical protein